MRTASGFLNAIALSRSACLCLAITSGLAQTRLAVAQVSTENCLQSYESTQRLRRDGDLIGAHEHALVCAHTSCATVLSRDCVRWLGELEAGQPTVTLKFAEGVDSNELSSLSLNGTAWPLPWDGRSVAVNPGQAQVDFTWHGQQPQHISLLISEGVKDQPIFLGTQMAMPNEPSAPKQTPSSWRWAVAGTSAAGLATFATFGVLGLLYKQDLKSCAPTCTADKRDRLNRDFMIADVGLGVGLAFGALAAWLWWPPSHQPAKARDVAMPVWFEIREGRSVLMFNHVY